MKTFLMLFISFAALRAAGPAAAAAQFAVPAGAVAIESNLYRYTDAQGTWIYRRTPFGVTRVNVQSVAPQRPESWDNTKAWDDGDAVRFERQGPFGVYRWRARKSDLDAAEQAFWARQQAAIARGKE